MLDHNVRRLELDARLVNRHVYVFVGCRMIAQLGRVHNSGREGRSFRSHAVSTLSIIQFIDSK